MTKDRKDPTRCSRCPKKPLAGRKMCRKHLEAGRAAVVAFRKQHRKKKLCLYCTRKARKNRKTCARCAAQRKGYYETWLTGWKKRQKKRADVPKKPKPKRPIKVPKPPVKRPPVPVPPPASMRCLFTGNKKRCKAATTAGPVCEKHQAFAAAVKIPQPDTRCTFTGNKKRCANQALPDGKTCEKHLGAALREAMGDLDKIPRAAPVEEYA